MGLIKDINNILEYGRKSSSLKYATLLSIFDYIIEHPSDVPINNFHFIPLVYIARQHICYYFPSIFTNIKQGTFQEGKKLSLIGYLEDFLGEVKESPELLKDDFIKRMIGAKEKGFIWFNRYLEVSEGLNRSVINLLKITRKKVLSMSLTHLHNVEGEIIRFFSIINQDIPFNSKYEKHIKMGNKNPFDKEIKTWLDFNEKEDTFLIINDLTYKRLVELRFWARDVIIKSWMEYLIKQIGRASCRERVCHRV